MLQSEVHAEQWSELVLVATHNATFYLMYIAIHNSVLGVSARIFGCNYLLCSVVFLGLALVPFFLLAAM